MSGPLAVLSLLACLNGQGCSASDLEVLAEAQAKRQSPATVLRGTCRTVYCEVDRFIAETRSPVLVLRGGR